MPVKTGPKVKTPAKAGHPDAWIPWEYRRSAGPEPAAARNRPAQGLESEVAMDSTVTGGTSPTAVI